MTRFDLRSVLLGVALSGLSALTHAALQMASFEGVVTANNPMFGTPPVGTPITGNYVIDAAILDGEGPNCVGLPMCWSGPDAYWTWNGQRASAATSVVPEAFLIHLSKVDHEPGAGADTMTVYLNGLGALNSVTLVLDDPTGGAFEGLADFTSKTFSFRPFCPGAVSCYFSPYYAGTLATFSVSPVDEPSGLAMTLSGALALALWRRRASRHDTVLTRRRTYDICRHNP